MKPLALFDSMAYISEDNDYAYLKECYNLNDIKISIKFLKSYTGSQGTFNSYRREIDVFYKSEWCECFDENYDGRQLFWR